MSANRLIVSAAGSGKTTLLADSAISTSDNVLITTYTEVNEDEIRKKILLKNRFLPKNVTVQTWFSFLLQHGVRPYQSIMDNELSYKKIGFFLVEGRSGQRGVGNGKPVYWGEGDFYHFYFTKDLKIYSDKISKFVFEVNSKMDNEIIKRISKIFPNIYLDEIQDLAGWDLEIIKLLLESDSNVIMVGDPRQSTYSTNDAAKHSKYKNGKILDFIEEKCKKGICEIDTTTLGKSHRNNQHICDFSSNIYPDLPKCHPCDCPSCAKTQDHQGIFLIKPQDVDCYLDKHKSVKVLRYSKAVSPEINFGASKGLGFERVLIYPTDKIKKFLKTGDISDIESVQSKFYVALTRAKLSVAIVCDYDDGDYIEGTIKYDPKD